MGAVPEIGLNELREKGWKALVKALGITGAIRFLMIHGIGEGTYLEERQLMFKDMSITDILGEMRDSR